MKLKNLGANKTVLILGDAEVLFSYNVPVAYRGSLGQFRTARFHSATTSGHISQWGARNFEARPQAWFTALIEEI